MRIEPLIDMLSIRCCINHLSCASLTSLGSDFGNRFIPDPFRTNTLEILVDFKNHLDRRIYETKFPTHVSFFFPPFYISLITSTFSSTLTIFVGDCRHIITLPVS
jgi:phosphoribosyl 1,2-cyclic phosphodiesterase